MRIVIAGGHGQIALRLERLLAARGDEVAGIVRKAEQADDLRAAGAEPVVLDLESASVEEVAERMREDDDEFAVVLDEHGGVAGVVTYEDIAEELVGDIADESDTVTAVAVADGEGWLVDAGRRLDEVAEATGVELPEEDDYETVAGLVVDRLGRFPAIGDRLTVELRGGGSAVIDVRTLDRHVPERIRIEWLAEKAEEQA